MSQISKDEFDSWLESPVTRVVFDLFKEHMKKAEETWMAASWEKGRVDPVLLADLRARYSVLRQITTLTHEDIE
jgi:hypothetical protein